MKALVIGGSKHGEWIPVGPETHTITLAEKTRQPEWIISDKDYPSPYATFDRVTYRVEQIRLGKTPRIIRVAIHPMISYATVEHYAMDILHDLWTKAGGKS